MRDVVHCTENGKKVRRPQGPKQKNVQELRQIKTFREIMSAVDANGDYNDVRPVEFRSKINLKHLQLADRNYIKNQAVALMRFTGMSPAEVAFHFGIAASTVNTWRSKVNPDILIEIEQAELNLVKARVAQTVTTVLGAAERVALYASEREYVQKQTPEGIMRIFEVLTDFSVRLIEAKQRSDVAAKEAAREKAGFTWAPQSNYIDIVPAM